MAIQRVVGVDVKDGFGRTKFVCLASATRNRTWFRFADSRAKAELAHARLCDTCRSAIAAEKSINREHGIRL
jgi:hypothetical protein